MKKALKAAGKIIFSRTIITFVLLAVQIMILFSGFMWFGKYMHFLMGGFTVLSGAVVVYILNKNDSTAYKLAWIVPVCVIPVFGALLYLFVELNPGCHGVKYRLDRRLAETAQYLKTPEDVRESLKKEDAQFQRLADYIQSYGGYPARRGTKASYFPLGEDKFDGLLKDLRQAEHFIFLEYFIIEEGKMWNAILDILKEKAAQGVEVRVMYDGMCSLLLLPYNYPKKLDRMGIRAKMFAPIRPMLSTAQNNRDHRKVLVIDGKIAYTGGVNLADEYINEKTLHGHWKDIAIRLEGDAADSFTLMFLQMWNVTEDGEEQYDRYIRKNLTYLSQISGGGEGSTNRMQGPDYGYVIPYADAPNDKEQVAENVYLDILYTAKRYVHIMTPYLIIDDEMKRALEYAAKRGVEVALILPHIPDKKIPFYIAHTYYPSLLRAGVKIYEYTPGFVHAKCFVSDDEKAVVGTINMDYRSLYLHFECGAYLYRNPVIREIESDYQRTLLKCTPADMGFYRKIKWHTKLAGWIFRLFGPLM